MATNITKEQWIQQVLTERSAKSQKEPFEISRVDFKCQNKTLWVLYYADDHRQRSTFNLVKDAFLNSQKPNFEFIVCADDIPRCDFVKPWFCYSTNADQMQNNDFSTVVPDYAFDSLHLKGRYGFPGNGDDDFTSLVNSIVSAGNFAPATNKIGWVGYPAVACRQHLLSVGHLPDLIDFCDFINVTWYKPFEERTNDQAWPDKFMSFAEQVKKWRFIIDVPGNSGWTDRLKFYFYSKRAIFIQERTNHEFYFNKLIPWVHFIPVSQDLSNLKPNILKLLSDHNLEKEIIANAYQFAKTHLTRENAVLQYQKIIDETNWFNCNWNLPRVESSIQISDRFTFAEIS